MGSIKIISFDERFATAFAALNYAWIEESYTVEPHDKELLDDPYRHIIMPGGKIFFAILDEAAVGTVALINGNEDCFELAKMAVSPAAQNRGIGRLLIEACIDHAVRQERAEVVLESNTRQEAAIHLYRSMGFEEIPLDPDSLYTRANIRMRLALSNSKL